MSPLAPFRLTDMGDHIYRRSWRWMRARPSLTARKNITRQRGSESDEERGR